MVYPELQRRASEQLTIDLNHNVGRGLYAYVASFAVMNVTDTVDVAHPEGYAGFL